MNEVNQQIVPEIFKRHIGTWKGEYIKTNPKGHFRSSFLGTFTFAIEGTTYRQVNDYEFPDGKRLTLNFEGEFKDGILIMSSSSYSDFHAIAWDAGQDTIGFRATKTQDGGLITFVETVNLLTPNHRVRSTQAFKDGVFDGISFIEETRL
ncbi:MAG: DUF3598 family protein [Cyanobacteria bacterium J06592_8]